MEESLPNLSALATQLKRARVRTRIGIWLATATWGLTAALALFIGLELVRRQAPGVWQAALGDPATGAGIVVWSAAIVGVAVMAIALIASPAPSIQTLARRADIRFGLDERVSTAFDIERRRDTGLLAQLLVGEAADRARLIDPRALAPLKFTWPMGFVPVLAVLALGVVTLVPAASVPVAPAVAGASTVLDSVERAELAADIERVAALVQAQADTRDDAYMAAVARSLQSLGERLANDPQASHSDLVQDLNALRDYAASAATDWRGAVGQRVPELLDALAARAEAAAPIQRSQEMPELPPNMMMGEPGAPEQGEPSAGPASSAAEGGGSASDELSAMLDDMEQNASGRGQPSAAMDAGGEQPRISVDYLAAAKAQNAQRSDEPTTSADGAQLIGPSSNAQAGDSLLAGQGTDVVDGATLESSALAFETNDDLMLEANDSGTGRRIEMEIAPPAQLTEVTGESLAAGAAGWARSPEAEVGREFVGAHHRDMVSTYRLGLSGQGQQ